MFPVKPQGAHHYERSLEMGNTTSEGVAGRCISAREGYGDRVCAGRMPMSRCSLADRE